jgi:hypothetical protein
MSGEVKLIRGNDRIRQLAGRPDITDDIAQIRAAMAEADRAYAMRLVADPAPDAGALTRSRAVSHRRRRPRAH